MNNNRQVLVIGLDAADHLLIERWAAEGYLPVIARLLKGGAYGILNTTAEIFSGSAWISIANGCGPAQCGVYSRYQLTTGTYDVRRVKASDCKIKPFWSNFEGPLVVVDVPKVPLLPDVDGIQIVEWGAYDHYSQFSTQPLGLARHILAEFGNHPFIASDFEMTLQSRHDLSRLRTLLIEGIKLKKQLTIALIKRIQPRFMFTVFGEPHAAGHAFWRFQDPCHPRYEPTGPHAGALRDTYRAIDTAIGEIIGHLPANFIVVLLSSQGFCLDAMADEMLLCDILTRTNASMPRTTLTKYAPYAPSLSFDLTRSQAFCLPTDLQGYIRINLRGREPDGLIPESQYASVCQELTQQLLSMRHKGQGVPLVSKVIRVRDRMDGALIDDLPDLSVVWNQNYLVGEIEGPTIGCISRFPDLRSGGGNHRGVGFALIHGSGIKRGEFAGHVFDLAPSIASWLTERSQKEWEGQVLAVSDLQGEDS